MMVYNTQNHWVYGLCPEYQMMDKVQKSIDSEHMYGIVLIENRSHSLAWHWSVEQCSSHCAAVPKKECVSHVALFCSVL
jgi:hypothetical protein